MKKALYQKEMTIHNQKRAYSYVFLRLSFNESNILLTNIFKKI